VDLAHEQVGGWRVAVGQRLGAARGPRGVHAGCGVGREGLRSGAARPTSSS
jgi:hypothetical protein